MNLVFCILIHIDIEQEFLEVLRHRLAIWFILENGPCTWKGLCLNLSGCCVPQITFESS